MENTTPNALAGADFQRANGVCLSAPLHLGGFQDTDERIESHLRPVFTKRQEGCIGGRADAAQNLIQVQGLARCPTAGERGCEAQLIALSRVQRILTGLDVRHVCFARAMQAEGLNF